MVYTSDRSISVLPVKSTGAVLVLIVVVTIPPAGGSVAPATR